MKSRLISAKEMKMLVFSVAMAYLICAVICFFHIRDVRGTFAEQIEEGIGDSVDQIESLSQDFFYDLDTYVRECSRELETEENLSVSYIGAVLSGIENGPHVERAIYVRNDIIYTSSGIVISETLNRFWEDTKKGNLTRMHIAPSVIRDNAYNIVVPVPIKEKSGQTGYVVAVYDSTLFFDEPMFDRMKSENALFLVGKDGVILDESVNSDFDIDNNKMKDPDMLVRTLFLAGNNTESKKSIQTIRNSFFNKNHRMVYIESPALDGDEVYINTLVMNDIDEVAIVVFTDFSKRLAKTDFFVGKTWIVLLIIIVITLAGNLVVWKYLQSSTVRIERMAYVDDVTKGKNLNFFRQEAAHIIMTNQEVPFVIQRFDIANFRYLNEAYGHMRADEVLKACIDIYTSMYSEKELCVRMSSDQFLTLTVNDIDIKDKRERYVEALNHYSHEKGIKYPINLKFGVYQVRKMDHDIDIMIDRANVARKSLLHSKNEHVAYYTDAIIQDMRKVENIEASKQKALETGEFKVYLQAKWDIINDHVAGAEALVRWIKEDGNMVFPDEFIPIFEENGFIEQLDFYMLESVCRRMAEVKKEGGTIYPVSVNQSRVLLHNPDYLDKIREIFTKYDIPRDFVELEVTETSLADNKEHMVEVLKELKDEHVRLDMDDFGSGYSSLNLLKDMPFDVLKIDREFFSESITSESSTLILRKIIEMADGLGIEVICEGVENQDQVDLLKDLGCKRVQGYFYSRPIPMEDYIKKYCMS